MDEQCAQNRGVLFKWSAKITGVFSGMSARKYLLPGVASVHLRAFSIPPTAPAAPAQGSARQSEFSDTDIWLCSLLDLIRVHFQSR